MDSEGYQSILKDYLKPFIDKVYPDGHRLWQDNDPKHVSKATIEWMTQNNINHWPTPSESPDINAIERVWAELKYHIRRRVKPTTKDQLTQGIKDFWLTVDPAKCKRYINHIPKVAKIIIEKLGAAAGH